MNAEMFGDIDYKISKRDLVSNHIAEMTACGRVCALSSTLI